MEQPGVPIPAPYNDPANWPFKWATYEEARGFLTRIRAEGSKEAKAIAQEYGVHKDSIRRAVRWYLLSVGQYAPDEWFAYQRQRKAEARRTFMERMKARDETEKQARQQQRQHRAAVVQRLSLEDHSEPAPLHVATSYSDEEDRRRRRRELQRKLNARNKSRW